MSDPGSDFLAAFRSRLESRNLPTDSIETLVGLVSSVIPTGEGGAALDQEILTRLATACEDNVTLLALITQQAQELDALKRITLNLTSSLELKVVLDEVVQEAMRLVKAACLVQIHLEQGEKMVPSASLDAQAGKDKSEPGKRYNDLIRQVTRSREIQLVEDTAACGNSRTGSGEARQGSVIGLPLKMSNRLVGIMILARSHPGVFNRSEIRLLKLLSDQASIAIVNARLHQAVNQQARFDVLTGLPNRLALEERLDEEITGSLQSGKYFSLIMLDLDNFKKINDFHGHECGDDVLRQVARFLQENLVAGDFVARYGGDEFALLLPGTDLAQGLTAAEKMGRGLKKLPFHLSGDETTTMSVSGGIAIHPLHADKPAGLMRSADEALYRAKRSSPGTIQVAGQNDA